VPLKTIFSQKPPFFLFLAFSLSAVCGIEQAVTLAGENLTLAPPISIVSLGIFAAFFSWRIVIAVTPIFALTSYFMILGIAHFPSVRAASVVIAGVLAAWAARQREHIENQAREIEAILQALPIPWILSDSNGNVTRISAKSTPFFSLPAQDVVGTSYFALFNPLEGKGEFIRRYLGAFDTVGTPVKLDLALSSFPGKKVVAHLSRLDCGMDKRLLTVLETRAP